MEVKVCPRCGEAYNWIETRRVNDNQVYFYAVHDYGRGPDGKRKVKKCYLGPKEYFYVAHLHYKEGLDLHGLIIQDRLFNYLVRILDYLLESDSSMKALGLVKKTEEGRVDINDIAAMNLADRLQRLAEKLRHEIELYRQER